MNAQTILMIIEIIKLLQAGQAEDKVAAKIIDEIVEGSKEDKALLLSEIKTLDLSFVGKLLNDMFGKK